MTIHLQQVIRFAVRHGLLACCCSFGLAGIAWSQQGEGTPHDGHAGHGTEIGQVSPAAEPADSVHDRHGVQQPEQARDPAAYSDGYGFGPLPRMQMSDQHAFGALVANRLEGQWHANGPPELVYDLQAWYGGSYDRLLLKAEGAVKQGRLDEAHTEAYWSHAVSPYWDALLGLRYDSGEKPGQGWLACGLQGLAPYWVELKVNLYLGHTGQLAARLEAEYELLLTQRLILQPRLEATLYSKRDEQRETGSGLSEVTAGLRLRYEFSREYAPYLGVEWYLPVGESRRISGKAEETRLVAGLRLRF